MLVFNHEIHEAAPFSIFPKLATQILPLHPPRIPDNNATEDSAELGSWDSCLGWDTCYLCPWEQQATDIKHWHQQSELPRPTIPGSLNIVQGTHTQDEQRNFGALKAPTSSGTGAPTASPGFGGLALVAE